VKNIYVLFCFLILAGCAKKAAVIPVNNAHIVVTYNFKASIIGNYSLYYINPNSPKQQVVQFSDTTWSKTDTIKTGSYAEGQTARLALGTLQLVSGASYSLTISVDNKVVSNGSFTPNTLFVYISDDYPVYH